MSAPYVGKRVVVTGTTRDDLNGSGGECTGYDREKGRYTVRLDQDGQSLALKPCNLQEVANSTSDGAQRTPPNVATNVHATSGGSSFGPFGIPWPTLALIVMGLAWVYQALSGGSGSGAGPGLGLWGDDDVEYDDRDDGYLAGYVREVATLDQLRGVLAQHSDNTGLPIVIDFFSHSCGPCRMVAPVFRRMAGEYKGRAVFIKVDVNRNYEASEACRVRAMPTFQLYLNKKKVYELSGADERSLRRYTASIAQHSEDAGTYVGQHVSAADLQAFYEVHDPAKVDEVPKLAAKYEQKTAQLVRVCKQKYGKVPEVTERQAATEHPPQRSGEAGCAGREAITSLSAEALRTELRRLQEELQRRGGEQREAEEEVPLTSADGAVSEGVERLVIVGGGPSALSAAVYAARAGLRPLVVAPAFGGQLLGKGVDVENYAGATGERVTGRRLVELMRRQAYGFEARFVDASVVASDFRQKPLRLHLNGTENPLEARAVIVASGAESRWLGVDGEHAFRGRGVSACATCDGFLHRGKDVVVVGGGDHAMEDALHLARNCRQVTMVHRRGYFRASKVLADRVREHPSIRIRWNTTVESFHGGTGDVGLTHVLVAPAGIDGGGGNRKERLDVSGAFVAIGHDPATDFVRSQLELDRAGYVVLREGGGSTATSVPGVFAAGDVADPTYRQAITASGSGAMAALDAERWLHENEVP